MIRTYPMPMPTNASKVSINEFAERIAIELNVDSGDPLGEVISQLGGKVVYRDPVGETYPESIKVEDFGDFSIFLPTMTSQARDRFTVAHELGHYFLHFPLVAARYPEQGMTATRWVDDTNVDLQRTEWEANWFAAGFLMPTNRFQDCYEKNDIFGVANIFGVSVSAARVRASSLGL